MHIDRLQLVSFGKFKGKDIDLKPRLNVLFGPNEAGKSTVERFVLGMLYGASEFGLKIRRMRREFESLRPWGGDSFEGRMVLTLDGGRSIRVERDFDSEDVDVYDDVTGEKTECEVDRRREPKFAQEMLGFSGPEFEGTVCIGQMKTADIEDESTTAIAEHMARALTGGEGESAEKAMAILAQREGEIGSEKAPTKPYAMALDKSREVKERLKNVESERSANLEREVRLRELQGELAELKAQKEGLAKRIEVAERTELRALVERVSRHVEAAAKHEADTRRFDEGLKPLAALGEIPKEDAHGVKAKLDAYNDRRRADESAASDRERREQEIADLEKELEALGIRGDPSEIEARVDDLQDGIMQARMEIATRASTTSPTWRILWAAAAILAVVAGVGLGVSFSHYAFALTALAIPCVLLAIRSSAALRAEIAHMRDGLEAKQAELVRFQEEHGCSGPSELTRKLDEATMKRRDLDRAREVLRALEESKDEPAERILQSLVETLRSAAPCSERIARAAESGRVGEAEAEEFTTLYRAFVDSSNKLTKARGDAVEAWRLAAESVRGLKSTGADWIEPLHEACSSRDPSAARAALEAGRKALGSEEAGAAAGPGRPASELRTEREKVASDILTITGEAGRLDGEINEAHEGLGDPGSLAREHQEFEQKLADMKLQRRALARAKAVIARVAEEMHRDFAPKLASRVGPIIASLTCGRYTSVRIGEALELKAESPETGELVPVEELSAGTLDQFYFALRIGAALELASGAEKPPIICDESLVQYDDERALACLKYLHELGGEHQVLLLTCRERERKAALDLGANVIAL